MMLFDLYGLLEYAESRSVENAENLSNFCVAICDFTPHPCKCCFKMLEIIETR